MRGEIALMGNVNNQADGSKYTFSHVPGSTFYREKRTESRMSYTSCWACDMT